MRLPVAVALILAALGAAPLFAQPDLEDEAEPGLEAPELDEPDVDEDEFDGEEDEPEAPPEEPEDHGSRDGEGHRFEGGADDDLPTEPAADVDPGAEAPRGPAGAVPAVPVPPVPPPPSPGSGPARPAAPAVAPPASQL